MLILLFMMTIYTLAHKKWMIFFTCLMMLARECVIFLTAPASFIQYSYPVMYAAAFLFMMLLLEAVHMPKEQRVQ